MLELERSSTFKRWFERLKDNRGKKLVLAHIRQVQVNEAFVGDCKSVGGGVTEIRVHVGAGYRVYAAIHKRKVLLLLVGGDKSSQERDIKKAQELFVERIKQDE